MLRSPYVQEIHVEVGKQHTSTTVQTAWLQSGSSISLTSHTHLCQNSVVNIEGLFPFALSIIMAHVIEGTFEVPSHHALYTKTWTVRCADLALLEHCVETFLDRWSSKGKSYVCP